MSLVMNGKFAQSSKSLKILWTWLADKKLSEEHIFVNSKRILKILKCSSLTLLFRSGIRNEKYAIYGNMEIGKIWKKSGYDIYYFMTYTLCNTRFFIRKFYKRKWASKALNLKKMLRKSPASNPWAEIFKNADFS